jgi:hypothetical protein
MKNLEIKERRGRIEQVINSVCEGRPKGGNGYQQLLTTAAEEAKLRLFIPWAAPADGRRKAEDRERATLSWIYDSGGFVRSLSKIVNTEVTLMPADSYAERNGFNLVHAWKYWDSVTELLWDKTFQLLPASQIEDSPDGRRLRAEEAYALEKMNPATREKVIAAACKYTRSTETDPYQNAAEYAMARAAESRYVAEALGALWVSLNWPERDAMCNTPRVYAPEEVRTPWLKTQV